MKKIAYIIVFILLITSPSVLFGQTATPQTEDPASVTIIGDSLTTDAGAGTKLKQAFSDIYIDAETGRSWSSGLSILNTLKTNGQLKKILVFALGTNQGITQANIDSLITAVPDKKIVLMTIYRGDVVWDDDANVRIKSAASANPNIKIADWNTTALQHPEWFGADGTHPNTSGYSELAKIIEEAVISHSTTNPISGIPQNGSSNCVITKVGNPIISPPPCLTGNLRQSLIDQFNLTMNGFDEVHLQWIYEYLQTMPLSNFVKYISGATIEARCSKCGSIRVGCQEDAVSVYLGQYNEGAPYFKFIFTHELGHFIHACIPRNLNGYVPHLNAIYIDGPISYYAGHAAGCALSDNKTEDYADMIAYYLNPLSGHVSGPIGCESNRTPPNPLFQLKPPKQEHLNVVKKIL